MRTVKCIIFLIVVIVYIWTIQTALVIPAPDVKITAYSSEEDYVIDLHPHPYGNNTPPNAKNQVGIGNSIPN